MRNKAEQSVDFLQELSFEYEVESNMQRPIAYRKKNLQVNPNATAIEIIENYGMEIEQNHYQKALLTHQAEHL